MSWSEQHRDRQRGINDARNRARAEDLAFMVEHGEDAHGAARRLGITRSALEHWCRRHKRADLWAALLANAGRVEVNGAGARAGRVTLGRVS